MRTTKDNEIVEVLVLIDCYPLFAWLEPFLPQRGHCVLLSLVCRGCVYALVCVHAWSVMYVTDLLPIVWLNSSNIMMTKHLLAHTYCMLCQCAVYIHYIFEKENLAALAWHVALNWTPSLSRQEAAAGLENQHFFPVILHCKFLYCIRFNLNNWYFL